MTDEDDRYRTEVLTTATNALVSRVGALADAMQVNNHKIDALSAELATKPDDAEVQFITGLAAAERKRHLWWAIGSGVISAVVAGGVSYHFSNQQVDELRRNNYNGCLATNHRVEETSGAFRDVVNGYPESEMTKRVLAGADRIDATRRNCEKIYAKGTR